MTETRQDAPWPLPRFYFEVAIKGVETMSFQEVTGLAPETQAIAHRSGGASTFSVVKMPGLAKHDHVTLKRGIVRRDHGLLAWYANITMNTIERADVTISLLDETGKASMVWTLAQCWVVKLTGADFHAGGNDVAIESVELAHDGITTTQP